MMQMNWQRLIWGWLLTLTLAISGCGGQAVTPSSVNPPANQATSEAVNLTALPVEVDIATTHQLREQNEVVVLDVREDGEYAEGHIPGAVLIPLGQLPERLNEIPRDKTVVAVCRSGNRSGKATQLLREQGFANVHNMRGGMNAWGQAGYEIEK